MTNEEQVALLRQGAEIWNLWRKAHPGVRIDLSIANFSNTDLRSANLRNANLSNTDLRSADLRNANLSNTDLRSADLRNTNLRRANLSNTDLQKANLSFADLIGADLRAANLYEANLSGVDLIDTDFLKANLQKANLYKANLSGANLIGANLILADLSNATLSGSDLRAADLSRATLSGSDLSNADLSRATLNNATLNNATLNNANLYAAQVLNTNFEGATLTGACIGDWQNSSETNLEGGICDFIFRAIDSDGNFAERRPANPNKTFESGEFTKLFQISQDTIELIFQEGMNWEAFASSFSETNTKVFDASGEELYLKKYEVLGDGLVRLEVTVPLGSDKQVIHDDLEKGYEQRIAQLQGKYEKNIARLEGKLESKDEDYQQLLRALKPGDTYVNTFKNEINQTFHGPVGNVAANNYGTQQNTQYNYADEEE